MAEHAAKIVKGNVTVNKCSKTGDGQYHHHKHETVSLPTSLHAVHSVGHGGIILRGICRHNVAILAPEAFDEVHRRFGSNCIRGFAAFPFRMWTEYRQGCAAVTELNRCPGRSCH